MQSISYEDQDSEGSIPKRLDCYYLGNNKNGVEDRKTKLSCHDNCQPVSESPIA